MKQKLLQKHSWPSFIFLLLIFNCSLGVSQTTFIKIFGPGTSGKYISQNSDGGYIVALDSNGIYNVRLDGFGNVQWANNIIDGNSYSGSIEEDPRGGFIFCGTTEDTTQFTNVATVLKLDSNGDSIWQKTFPPGYNGSSGRLIIPTKDSLYMFAYYEDGQLHTNRGYLLKLDTNGNTIWTNGTGNRSVSSSGLIQDDDTNFVYTSSDGTNASFFSFGKFTNAGSFAGFNTMGDDTISPCYCLENATCISQSLDDGYLIGAITSSKAVLIKLNNLLDTLWTKDYNHFVSPTSCVQDNDSGFMILASDYYRNANEFSLLHVNKDGDSLGSHSFNVLSSCSVAKMKKCADGGFIIIGTAIDSLTMENRAFVVKTDALGRVLQNLNGDDSFLDWVSFNPCSCYADSYSKYILTDDSCNVYISGFCADLNPPWNFNILTVKYDVFGDTVWTRRNGSHPMGMKFDRRGNIIVIGRQWTQNPEDWIILKYSPEGTLLDSTTYNNTLDSIDVPISFDIDDNGNIIVVGYSVVQGFKAEKVVKFDSLLNLLWESPNPSVSNGDHIPKEMKLINDSTLCIISTLYSGIQGASNSVLLTEIYRIGSGVLFSETYGTQFSSASEVLLGDSGSIFICGKVDNTHTVLLKYDSQLNLVWSKEVYDYSWNEQSMAIDIYDNIYITSFLNNNGMFLNKYSAAGILQWSSGSSIDGFPKIIVNNDSIPSAYLCGVGSVLDSLGNYVASQFSVFAYDRYGQLQSHYPMGYHLDSIPGHYIYSEVQDATIDKFDNIYITGATDNGDRIYQTIKFSMQNFNTSIYHVGNDSISVNTGEYYQWYKDGLLIVGATLQGLNYHAIGVGNYHCEIVKGCKSFTSDSVLILCTTPSAPIITNDGPKCEGQTLCLTSSFTPGATFYWNGPNGYSSTSPNPCITNAQQAATGNYTCYIDVNGCVSLTSSTYVIINSTLIPTINSSSGPYCQNANCFPLSASPIGGTFSGSGVSGNQFCPLNGSIGINTVNYSVTQNGCTGTTTQDIILNEVPSIPTITSNGSILTASSASCGVCIYQWFDGSDSICSPSDTCTISRDGIYTVEIWKNGCSSTSQPFIITGLIDNLEQAIFSVFPNPTSESFEITFDVAIKQGLVTVYNSIGEVIFTESFFDFVGGASRKIQIQAAQGIYLLEIRIEEKRYIQKLIIE